MILQLFMYLTLFLVLIPASILLYIIYHTFIKIYISSWRFQKMDPSLKAIVGPLGLLGQQNKSFTKHGDSFYFVKQMIRQNPDLKAYTTNIGHISILILCDAQLIKEFLLQAKKFRKFDLYKHSNQTFAQGLIFTEGEMWARQRSIAGNSFNHQSLKKMIPIIQNGVDKFVERLNQQINSSENKKIDFKVLHGPQVAIGEILIKIIFGIGAIDTKVRGKPLSIALAEFTAWNFQCSRSFNNIFWSMFFGQKVVTMNFCQRDKEVYKYISEIRQVLKEVIDKRLQMDDSGDFKDFLQVYVNQKKQNERLISEAKLKGQQTNILPIEWQQIMHQLITFYFAGIDTTGHLIAFAFYSLAEHPQHAKTIKQQIKKIFGNEVSNISYENLGKMKFTENFIDEVLRMWPPLAQHLQRIAKVDVQIGPYKIPKGTLIGSSILACVHNPKYYDNPQVFDPYRWQKPGGYTNEPYSFIPFSAGPRSCIGKYLALLEVKIVLIKFLINFDFERTEVPLRTHLKLLYEPFDENLIRLRQARN